MTKLQRHLTVLASLVLAVVGYAVPAHVFASAVTVSAFTATSTPAYTNTGLATTSRAKVGDTIQYQLTLSGGAPLVAPQINVLSTGSTTMTGSGNNWWYATTTTSNSSVWANGLVTFKVSVGQDTAAGTATTTVVAVTSGANVTFDSAGPTLSSVSWNDVDGSTEFSAGDTLAFTFNETMATTTIATGNADTTLGLSAHTFGTTPTISWNTPGTILTLTLASDFTVASGDTVDPTSAVKDAIGNADATAAPVAITDGTAPPTPTGLSDTTFSGTVPVTLTSSGSTDIHYTTDGTTPSCTVGTLYSTTITISGTVTLQAIACDGVDNASSVASATYTHHSVGGGGGGGHSSGGGSSGSGSSTGGTSVSDLMAQIAQLQAMLAALTGANPNAALHASGNASFLRDLDLGAVGDDVKALQEMLIAAGFDIKAGATGYFGGQTQAALAKWQAANGISPAAGFFGPKTRAAVGK